MSDRLEQLENACRARPSAKAIELMRDSVNAMKAMATTRDERIEAEGFVLALEMLDRINRVLK